MRLALMVWVPAAMFGIVNWPWALVTDPCAPTVTPAPERGAPSVFVTVPVTCPVVCAHASPYGSDRSVIARSATICGLILLIESLQWWSVLRRCTIHEDRERCGGKRRRVETGRNAADYARFFSIKMPYGPVER